MKRISILSLFIYLFLVSACVNELDNYDAPNGGVYGTIIDSQTNEAIPLPVEGSGGVMIRMLEIGTGATKTIDFYAMHDGSFKNSMLFNCNYSITVDGPFVNVQEGTVKIAGQTEAKIQVTPYARIKAMASISGRTVTVDYEVAKTSDSFVTTDVYGYWHYAPKVDDKGSNFSNKYVVAVDNASKLKGVFTFNLDQDDNFNDNLYKIESNNSKIYFRVGAKTEGKINYSKIIELTIR